MKDDRLASSLDVRQQCRNKVSIFFDSRENFYHPIIEVMANASDEVESHRDKGEIYITLMSDNKTVEIRDNGRGVVLFTYVPDEGMENYQCLFEKLFSGTKYEDLKEVSERSENRYTGCNGVGTCVINHTSLLFEVTSKHDGVIEILKYANGGELVEKKKEKYTGNDVGSTFKFKLDPEVYTETEFNPKVVLNLLKHIASVSNKTTIYYTAEALNESFTIHYDAPIDFFKELGGENLTSDIAVSKGDYDSPEGKITIESIVATSLDPFSNSYLNRSYLRLGGSIEKQVAETLRKTFTDYCVSNNLMPKGIKQFTARDITDSFSFCCKIECPIAEYVGQAKLATRSKLYDDAIKQSVGAMMLAYEKENKESFDMMLKHLLTVANSNKNTGKIKETINKQLKKAIKAPSDRPEGLVDCVDHGPDSEIFIGEGRSACGALAQARKSGTQAIMPVRGKILNCLKANLSKIKNSTTIMGLMKALGTGILDEFDINLFRYGSLIIACDNDNDGFQIRQLILCMIWVLAKELILGGYVYFAETPLYRVVKSDGSIVLIYNEAEKESILKTIEGKYTISRFKGLGEAPAHLLYETAMNPETRRITRVVVENEEIFENNLKMWMGKDTTDRKEYILNHISEYTE